MEKIKHLPTNDAMALVAGVGICAFAIAQDRGETSASQDSNLELDKGVSTSAGSDFSPEDDGEFIFDAEDKSDDSNGSLKPGPLPSGSAVGGAPGDDGEKGLSKPIATPSKPLYQGSSSFDFDIDKINASLNLGDPKYLEELLTEVDAIMRYIQAGFSTGFEGYGRDEVERVKNRFMELSGLFMTEACEPTGVALKYSKSVQDSIIDALKKGVSFVKKLSNQKFSASESEMEAFLGLFGNVKELIVEQKDKASNPLVITGKIEINYEAKDLAADVEDMFFPYQGCGLSLYYNNWMVHSWRYQSGLNYQWSLGAAGWIPYNTLEKAIDCATAANRSPTRRLAPASHTMKDGLLETGLDFNLVVWRNVKTQAWSSRSAGHCSVRANVDATALMYNAPDHPYKYRYEQDHLTLATLRRHFGIGKLPEFDIWALDFIKRPTGAPNQYECYFNVAGRSSDFSHDFCPTLIDEDGHADFQIWPQVVIGNGAAFLSGSVARFGLIGYGVYLIKGIRKGDLYAVLEKMSGGAIPTPKVDIYSCRDGLIFDYHGSDCEDNPLRMEQLCVFLRDSKSVEVFKLLEEHISSFRRAKLAQSPD